MNIDWNFILHVVGGLLVYDIFRPVFSIFIIGIAAMFGWRGSESDRYPPQKKSFKEKMEEKNQ